MQIKLEVDTKEFLGYVLGSCFSTWSWWQTVKYDEGYSWDVFPKNFDTPYLTLGIVDPEDENGERQVIKKVSVNDIASAFELSGHRDWESLDAGSADWVMQHAVFGEAIYG